MGFQHGSYLRSISKTKSSSFSGFLYRSPMIVQIDVDIGAITAPLSFNIRIIKCHKEVQDFFPLQSLLHYSKEISWLVPFSSYTVFWIKFQDQQNRIQGLSFCVDTFFRYNERETYVKIEIDQQMYPS